MIPEQITPTPNVKDAQTSEVSKRMPILVSIVVLVSVGIAGFMWWQNQQPQKQTAIIPNAFPDPTIPATISMTPNPTKANNDWVEATMEATRVSVKLPREWRLGKIETGNRIEGENGCALIDVDLPVETNESLSEYAKKILMIEDLSQIISSNSQIKIDGKETINLGAQGIGERFWYMVKRDEKTIQSIHLISFAPEGMPMEEWQKHICYQQNEVEVEQAETVIKQLKFE